MNKKILLFSVLGLAMIGMLFAGCDVLQENLSDTIAAEKAAEEQAELDADTSIHSLGIGFVQDADGNVFTGDDGLPSPETFDVTVPEDSTDINYNVLNLVGDYNSEVVLLDIVVNEGASVTVAGAEYDDETGYDLSSETKIKVTSADGSTETYTLKLVDLVVDSFDMIGAAVAGWDEGNEVELEDLGDGVYGITYEFSEGEFLFRLNGDYNTKIGGSLDGIELGGDNIVVEDAGLYAVTVDVVNTELSWTEVNQITLNIENTPALTEETVLIGQSLFSDGGEQVNFNNKEDFYTVAPADHDAEGTLTYTLYSDFKAEDWFDDGAVIAWKLQNPEGDNALGLQIGGFSNYYILENDISDGVVTVDFNDLE